ncbi:hypothetical protein GCM10027592_45600 [Spirosoma flavus]
MQTSWLRTGMGCLLLGFLIALVGCHENPALPDSIIPYQCRVARVEVIDTTFRSTTTYDYDQSGNLIKVVTPTGTRTYTYASDGYLTKLDDGSTSLTYQYEGTPKRIKLISGGTQKYTYVYEGDNLKTYTAQNSTGETTYTYSGGQLTDVKVTSGNTPKVQNGKIVQYTAVTGNSMTDVYNNLDQLTSSESISSNGLDRSVSTYTYDDKLTYLYTGLFFRGFPKIGQADRFGQPGPYFNQPGQNLAINNIITLNTKTYRKAGTGWGDALTDKTLRYKQAYYQNRYSLGYDRSDGQRVRYVYSNCE